MLVPEGGRGEVRQVSVSLRAVRRWLAGLGTALVVLVLLVVVQVATASRVIDHDRVVGENLALRARLEGMERELDGLLPLVRRVKVYDDRLRELAARDALPGFGMLDLEEAEAHADWVDGVVGRPVDLSGLSPEERAAELARAMQSLAADLRTLDPRADQLDAVIGRLEAMADVLPQVWPLEGGVLTSRFGWRESPYGPGWKFHGGIDVGAPWGTPIYTTNTGLVSFSGWSGGHGMMVEVDHGGGVSSRYCHASKLLVEAGDEVIAGDLIALVGSTGVSTGPHLHYELFVDGEKVDPWPYLPKPD